MEIIGMCFGELTPFDEVAVEVASYPTPTPTTSL